MQHTVLFDPAFSMLEITLGKDEVLQSEAGVLVSKNSLLSIKTRLNAGSGAGFLQKCKSFLVALLRKILGGESFFINEFTATADNATLTIAPTLPGTILHRRLENQTLILQGGAYLASMGKLGVRVRYAGIKAFFSGHGLFFLEVSGTGDLFFSAFGGVLEQKISGTFVLDTGHLVAFEPSINYKIKSAGSLKSTLLSGEGLLVHFSGQGSLWFQSRSVGALVTFVNPRLPPS